jgi:hypothetical protein
MLHRQPIAGTEFFIAFLSPWEFQYHNIAISQVSSFWERITGNPEGTLKSCYFRIDDKSA